MTYKDIIVFGIGVAAGAIGMKFYMERKYAAWHEETFENVHIEVVDNPEDVVVSDGGMDENMENVEEIEEEVIVEFEKNSVTSENAAMKEEAMKQRIDYAAISKEYKSDISDGEINEEDLPYDPEGDDVTVKEMVYDEDIRPYFINDMDFNEDADGEFAKESLDFFMDNEVVVEDGEIVECPEEILGEENMDRMLTINADAVYIRNENTMTDYEVILIADKY